MTPERWQEIKKVLAGALERGPNERPAYLDQACPEPAMRREVESLIADHEQAQTSFLSEPAIPTKELSIGSRLGPYEIVARIGAGGMGVVYKARDARLNRIVAIKILADHLADRVNLHERFEREAKTIASLNHPHICTLYDVGRENGTDYLVMEYIEGETLAQRLLKGPLPLEPVLQYAIEISDALDKAHRKGITHRDLKPGNIMLTKSGTKLLDFGLAKLRQEAAPREISLSDLPTAKEGVTAQGTILGTLQYMAPEQVEGKTEAIDPRTDIFAFGVVVYEMATGKKAFEGASQASVIGAILKDDPPPISSLQPVTPPTLDRVVKKCLAKQPDQRWQDASDLCDEIRWVAEGSSQSALRLNIPVKTVRPFGWTALFTGLIALLLGSAIASLATWNLKPTPPRPVIRSMIDLPPGQQLAGLDNGPAVAISPDGTQLAYVAREGGAQRIYLRALDSLESKPITGTEGAFNPFFSPDGQWLGFFAGGKLKKISVSGGAVVPLADALSPQGATWSSEGKIIFAPGVNATIQQVSDSGGTPQSLTRFEKEESSHRWPEVVPGSKLLFFTTGATGASWINSQIAVQKFGSYERQNTIQGGTQPRYASSGYLVYAQAGALMAAPIDPRSLTVSGAAVPSVNGVLQILTTGVAQYSVSATGSLVYVAGGAQGAQARLVWVSRNGKEQPLEAPARRYLMPRLSPDGQRVAATIEQQDSQTWLYDIPRGTLTRLTFGGSVNISANWTPDGKRLAFNSNKEGAVNIFWQLTDGSGGLERLTTSDYLQAPTSWSPDGQLLVFHEINPNTQRDIWVLRMSDRKVQPFIHTPFDEAAPVFSHDGHWLAYVSNESGRYEVYVQAYPGPGGKYQISTDGGTEPVWHPSGRELYYRSGNKMMAVDISTQPGFTAGTPRMLFEGPYEQTPFPIANYDVSPDGQRFLMVRPVEQAQSAPTQINVVLNWFEELKQKVPTGKK